MPGMISDRHQYKVAAFGICLSLIVCLIAFRASARVDSSPDAAYAENIAKNYDFKFGPNPFAPSNGTSATGTFIPGEGFI
jgi:hypothetical protein